MKKPILEPSDRPLCVWATYPNGERKEIINPIESERARIEAKKLYQEKSGDYSY